MIMWVFVIMCLFLCYCYCGTYVYKCCIVWPLWGMYLCYGYSVTAGFNATRNGMEKQFTFIVCSGYGKIMAIFTVTVLGIQ